MAAAERVRRRVDDGRDVPLLGARLLARDAPAVLFAVQLALVPDRRLRGAGSDRDRARRAARPGPPHGPPGAHAHAGLPRRVRDRHALVDARHGREDYLQLARPRVCATPTCGAATPCPTPCCRSSACRRSTSGSSCRARSRSRRSSPGRVSAWRRSRRSEAPTSRCCGLFLLFSAALIVANLARRPALRLPRSAVVERPMTGEPR